MDTDADVSTDVDVGIWGKRESGAGLALGFLSFRMTNYPLLIHLFDFL